MGRRAAACQRAAAGLALACVLTACGRDIAAPAAKDEDIWTSDERTRLAALLLDRLPPPPPDPSNRVQGDPRAAALGRALFFDARLSANGRVSCASCHQPALQFQDGRPVAVGIGTGDRRTMPLAGVRHQVWFFWDGRKDSLWSQALAPLEDEREHGSTRTQVVALVGRHNRADYENLFGPLPDLEGLPAQAGPLGSPAQRQAWQALPAPRRQAMSAAYANVGKALAAYMATLRPGPSRLDAYIRAVLDQDATGLRALNAQEKVGLRLFVGAAGCSTCHTGPLMTDGHFHNTGVPAAAGQPAGAGRSAAVPRVVADEYNCLGAHSDARPEQCGELRFIARDDPHMLGAFRTPGLRGVALRAPYMHAGQFATLEDVLRHYADAPRAALGSSEIRGRPPQGLSAREQAALVSLLRAMDGPVLEGDAGVASSAPPRPGP